jgi:hypothetical protein
MINVAATGDDTARLIPGDTATVSLEPNRIEGARSAPAGTARLIPGDTATVSLEPNRIEGARSVPAGTARGASRADSRGSRASEPAATGVPGPRPSAVPDPDLERLGDEIAELAAHLHAATYRLLVRLPC